MRLIDRIAQCRLPLIVGDPERGETMRLSGAFDYTELVAHCPVRYVLSDDLTGLCTALAYSRGSRQLECADLLRVPSQLLWLEWCEEPWLRQLRLYGFQPGVNCPPPEGRRGALISASADGRRGLIRTFWSMGEKDEHLLASSMEAYFDLDTPDGEAPSPPNDPDNVGYCVADLTKVHADVLKRCFRFRYERSWLAYYRSGDLSQGKVAALAHHALGTIAADIPMMMAFLLLLSTRTGLPRRPSCLDRLNRSRVRSGKTPLLEHIEVLSPMARDFYAPASDSHSASRRGPRLHHVRGHLMRRGCELFWRVPHLRGSARHGMVQSRTVTWSVERRPGT
jgi:hypothetical protein